MKISYRNNLGIKIIESGSFDIDSMDILEQLQNKLIIESFNSQKELFKPIHIISKTISDIAFSHSLKVIENSFYNDIGICNGSIIMDHFTYCYDIKTNGSSTHDFSIYIFLAGQLVAQGFQNERTGTQVTIPNKWKFLMEENEKWGFKLEQDEQLGFRMEVSKDEGWALELFNRLYLGLVLTIHFLKYSEVQDKVIKANSKVKGIDCKYINETNSDVHYITSHYITNLYVQGAFKVSGHWRLQPKKKEGKWTKELIWINEFEKEGYTRQAEILNQTKTG